ncbi:MULTISPECIES: DUF1656 domain-containing protein [unclassified Mesorhizobium]|uniref:DUF1656 domain-containing protein n=1 Tax=unclassified Mesorhizobium TaxID=325217 RepID=UPI0011288F7F|nr:MULTISPECIES: DUF1656 domain-containing protein [unclassified Mesorhizobium]MBZ9894567.1 DUF1656 domain-containing protein [Mesorhizobium sp. BR1-1-6]TPM57504.1 DUF1656 domain-containing protein [Mesorhizobium sp. B2-2-4]TPM65693.1 DUF1656 domain-containing protein [Mesorhizobium sp. B2-2-1]TPN38397.1 DUF1656 domain-containing protein [Mesorhizobium sp. B1-1-6]TPN72018.1 DUF1656 domain-containing protein [Mesorhizobium sp. B1-1-3]
MAHSFHDLVIGGVLVAPFMTYAVAALFVVLLTKPLLRTVGFWRLFSNAAIAELSLYITILGLIALFL